MNSAEVEVNVERLDSDIIDEHLRTSTVLLHDIITKDREDPVEEEFPPKPPKSKVKSTRKSVQGRSRCTHCSKTFRTSSTLRAHVLLKHSDEQLSKCDTCDKVYPTQLSLHKHVRYMHLRHRCAVCYKTFDDAESLFEHSEGCKKVEIACNVCEKVYPSAVSLRNHTKYKHPAKMAHWCSLCRREFVSEANLENHRHTVHPAGETDCSCGQWFPSLARLQSHMLHKHSSDSHKCRRCHKVFRCAVRLACHIARLHQ